MHPARDAILGSFGLVEYMIDGYLTDLSDSELLTRPAPKANHIAWQLGHLIGSEHWHMEQVREGSMPALPDGFRERHDKEHASSDDAEHFLKKEEYIALMREQRAGTKALLESLSEAELGGPAPETVSYFGPTLGCVFNGEVVHWTMHSGQWAVLRRVLGREPLF